MNWNPASASPSDEPVARRSVLAAAAALPLSVSTSGCVTRVRSVVDDGGEQLSLRLGTVPTDDDRGAIRIARHLESNLEAAGIDVALDVRPTSEFLEAALFDHEFDLFIDRYPLTDAGRDPDFLYEALHSQFATAAGRQNPFGITDVDLDRALETQRRTDGTTRREAVASVLEYVAERKPFEPICRPTEHRLARTDRLDGPGDRFLGTGTGAEYLGLEPTAEVGGDSGNTTDGERGDLGDEHLEALLLDSRPSRNLNPLAATMRNRDSMVGLLYDSLGTFDREHGKIRPWLAASWEWQREENEASEPRTTARISLRDDASFHDGEPVTATDVAFTYRFLADTALGRAPVDSPAPRYAGRIAALEDPETDIEVHSETDIAITVAAAPEAARRIATVPILPAHVWAERLEGYGLDIDIGIGIGIDTDVDADSDPSGTREGDATEAEDANGAANEADEDPDVISARQGRWGPVTADIDPVGSGPYRLVDRAERDHVTLERHDGHFSLASATGPESDPESEPRRGDSNLPVPAFAELRFDIDPNSPSSIERVADGDADLTASMLEPAALERMPDDAVRFGPDTDQATGPNDDTPALGHLEVPSPSFYYLGFNTREGPVGNVHFRNAVAQLLDKAWIVETIFRNEAEPIATPVVDDWIPDGSGLAWDGTDPISPYPGDAGGNGRLESPDARAPFEERGFQYDDAGRLLGRY
ncbi:ABC transporter substrate-binding protein [Halobiforma nitratireducens]|uniref:Family 5 extracellular solute-binding protein n=1 Tax=Halobiforma nitratireducens JCM 10879 TaxID=1227454 RepID=M0LNS2_9EURY|nr:ABC transporter substrate-binding protein [Halobiforma nitratireducens]EMA34104.1 family 5 extracellular solute-binding protein [Halobiforma nitratireducens JCM 10879]